MLELVLEPELVLELVLEPSWRCWSCGLVGFLRKGVQSRVSHLILILYLSVKITIEFYFL